MKNDDSTHHRALLLPFMARGGPPGVHRWPFGRQRRRSGVQWHQPKAILSRRRSLRDWKDIMDLLLWWLRDIIWSMTRSPMVGKWPLKVMDGSMTHGERDVEVGHDSFGILHLRRSNILNQPWCISLMDRKRSLVVRNGLRHADGAWQVKLVASNEGFRAPMKVDREKSLGGRRKGLVFNLFKT